jgi:hypothetical protein
VRFSCVFLPFTEKPEKKGLEKNRKKKKLVGGSK